MLVAGLVGPKGKVVGTDLARTAILAAEKRAHAHGLPNVSFRIGDSAAMTFDQPFDAVVGRYVLQFIPDPSAAVAKLAGHLRGGGIMVFHELDWEGARSSPPAPTYDQLCGWIRQTLESAGHQFRLGARLGSVFERAGHPGASLQLESIIASGPTAIDGSIS
jgi:ubiquinone/menaquinone biosynthesis C-methylase UbiE